jgi:Trk K+ transport system NAD-binding subunit
LRCHEWTGLDIVDKSGVDIICDATNPDALLEADIDTAHTVVLALPDDTEAVFATLLIRELNSAVEIIARANNPESVPKLYRAGADSVLTLATVSGQMIAVDFLPEESMTSGTDQTQIVHTKAEKLVGQTLAESKVRTRTGVTVIAVEREGEILTGIDPSFTIREGDAVLVTGTQEEINQFRDFVE